ncbi:ClpP/crotonase-like domain-containing protein [Zopfochytrium polystomum]|nr:ClpP/crotonase-like domain-containing protein [Zopfochytrium polystomum]
MPGLTSSTSVVLTRDGPLFVVALLDGENRFTRAFLDGFNAALDYIEKTVEDAGDAEDAALVTVVDPASKYFSNGLDLSLISGQYLIEASQLLGRIMSFRIPTVAAVSGHAFAGGCLLALAHDFRVMRGDRGFICMNEIDLKMAIPASLMSLIRAKVSSPAYLTQMILLGERFSAAEAIKGGFVDEAHTGSAETIAGAKALARKVAPKARAGIAIRGLKEEMYREAVPLLRTGVMGAAAKL